MGHGNTSCDPHLYPSHQATNARLPHAKRPPPGGYVQTPYSYKSSILKDGSRIQRLAEFARIKNNSPGLITPKAGWSIRLSQSKVVWWTRPGSNRRPPHCERGALPAELLAHEQRNNFSKGPGACQHAFRRP